MHAAEEAECFSCSDCTLEFIEKKWTQLLLNWLNKCVHPKTPIKELNLRSMVDVLKKYKQDIRAEEIGDAILCTDVETFVRFKYPLLRFRFYDLQEGTKKMYLMTSIILFHCCVSSANGLVDDNICAHLSEAEQEMILKFCEILMDMEVTCNNIELAVKEACDSAKQDPRTFRLSGHRHDQKPSKQKTEPFESAELRLTFELASPSINSLAADSPQAEGLKQKQFALKLNPAESFNPSSTSYMTMSSFTSLGTDLAPANATFESTEDEFFVPCKTVEVTPFNSVLEIGKSPTGKMRQKINMTFKLVDSNSFTPCSTFESLPISKTLSMSPICSIVKRYNTTMKSVEYESYLQNPAPEKSSYNPKAKSSYKYNEYSSSNERPFNDSEVFDDLSTETLKQRGNAKYKSKDKYKSYNSRSRPRTLCTSKAFDKLAIEKKKKHAKSKTAKYKSYETQEIRPVIIVTSAEHNPNAIKFKSSVTVLPSMVTTDSEFDYTVNCDSKTDPEDKSPGLAFSKGVLNVAHCVKKTPTRESESERQCLPKCSCSRCIPNAPNCGDPGKSMNCNKEERSGPVMDISSKGYYYFEPKNKREGTKYNHVKNFVYDKMFWFLTAAAAFVLVMITLSILVFILMSGISHVANEKDGKLRSRKEDRWSVPQELSFHRIFQHNSYTCKHGLCQKIFEPTSEYIYSSLSRCILLCMGPQLWPKPIGYTYFSKKVVILATNKLEYKFQSVPSEAVHLYLAEAFKLFLGDLAKLERYTLDARRMNISRASMIKKMYIQMDVQSDPDPRLRLDTEESYTIKVETISTHVVIQLLSQSFCGIRHALETLSQLILLDQTTGNLITLSYIVIKDAPSYRYRGLMIDTGRNYIPVPDIMRTIDAMASVKLNTFHWRISDVASFPLHLPAVPQLFEYGAYSRSQIYTKDDVKAVVRRAGVRGIRVLLEVAAPGPVGRAWSWLPEATCPTKDQNLTCQHVLCLRLGIQDTVFDILQIIYSEILEMTKVHDVFHLSDGVFSLVNCFNLMADREGFLENALERLKLANKGLLPKLPIIWYTEHLTNDVEARTWDRLGVQLLEWHANPSEQFLSRFKVIHSSRWELSCEVKKQRCRKYRTWQDMYNWNSWRNLEVFTTEGGEATLWTDLVDTGNLDYHLWPRAAAVAERLWSDVGLNGTVSSHVYVRLDCQRWRMVLKSVQVQPIWPLYCSFSPGVCLEKIKNK